MVDRMVSGAASVSARFEILECRSKDLTCDAHQAVDGERNERYTAGRAESPESEGNAAPLSFVRTDDKHDSNRSSHLGVTIYEVVAPCT